MSRILQVLIQGNIHLLKNFGKGVYPHHVVLVLLKVAILEKSEIQDLNSGPWFY